jgi:two-component system response regulator HydG
MTNVTGSPETSTSLDPSRGEPVAGVVFVLRVIGGPDSGATIVLDGVNEGRILVGQSAVCTLRLTDRAVSRRHAALRRDVDAWRIEDLGSSNGTRVNGVRVKEALLSGGEILALGSTSLKLVRAGVAPVQATSTAVGFGRFLGASPEVRPHFTRWAVAAAGARCLLIEGEAGTGKELLAETLHDIGPRTAKPYLVLDCVAVAGGEIDETIVEQARGGTLVVDEPAALDSTAQATLAALVERAAGLDVRIITTSRRDLDLEVEQKRFDERLLDRLAEETIELPPLRRRETDIPLLASHFWKQLGGAGELPTDVLHGFAAMTWPGNVRELLNVVAERLAAGTSKERSGSLPPPADTARGLEVREAPATDAVARVLKMDLPYASARQQILREFEGQYVKRVLEQQNGNVSRAAAVSGLARRYFQILKSRAR